MGVCGEARAVVARWVEGRRASGRGTVVVGAGIAIHRRIEWTSLTLTHAKASEGVTDVRHTLRTVGVLRTPRGAWHLRPVALVELREAHGLREPIFHPKQRPVPVRTRCECEYHPSSTCLVCVCVCVCVWR